MGLTFCVCLNTNMLPLEIIVQEMRNLSDSSEVTEYIFSLGEELKTDNSIRKDRANYVRRCQSQLWVSATLDGAVVKLKFDSDSKYSLGLCAVLNQALNGQIKKKVLNTGIKSFADFMQFLPAQRQQGMQATLNLIQSQIR